MAAGSFVEIADGNATAAGLIVDASCNGVIIDRVDIYGHPTETAADRTIHILVYAPNQPPTLLQSSLVRLPRFIEGMQSTFDYAPLRYGSYEGVEFPPTGGDGFVADTLLDEVATYFASALPEPDAFAIALSTKHQIPLEIFLPPGAAIVIATSDAEEDNFHWTWNVLGRAF